MRKVKTVKTVTKRDVVREHIESAIVMYFKDIYPISIHTIISAANTVLNDLSNKSDRKFVEIFEDRVKLNHLRDFRKKMNEAANFFKHADNDHDASFDFNEEINDYKILACCIGYECLGEKKTSIMNTYITWFMSIYPDLLVECELKTLFQESADLKSLSHLSKSDKKKLFYSLLKRDGFIK